MNETDPTFSTGRRSSAGRGSTISRQFTEAESVLDEQITNHLTAPPVQFNVGDSLGQTYHFMREDMKMRSLHSAQLGQEQELAYSQSARHALAKQADKSERDDLDAIAATQQIRDMVTGGMSFQDASNKVFSDDPSRLFNPKLTKGVEDFSRYYETDEEKEDRQLKESVSRLGLNKQQRDLEMEHQLYEENPELVESNIGILKKKLEAEAITAENAPLRARIEAMESSLNFKKAQIAAKEMDDLIAGIGGSGDDINSEVEIQALITKGGFPKVGNVKQVMEHYGKSPYIKEAMFNKRWIDTNLSPEERDTFAESLSIASDPNKTNDERREAHNFVIGVAGRYTAETKTDREIDARRKEVAATLGDVEKVIAPKITAFRKELDDSEDTTPEAVAARYGEMVDEIRIAAGGDPLLESAFTEYEGYVKNVGEQPEAGKSVAAAKDAITNLRKKMAEIKRAAIPGKTDSKAQGIPLPKGGTETVERDGKTWKWNPQIGKYQPLKK